jgi:hypothetical protein
MDDRTKDLIVEAHAFAGRARELRASTPGWLDFPDEIKLKCVDYLIRGISASVLAKIMDIPRSTLRGWKIRATLPVEHPIESRSREQMEEFFKENFQEISISECRSIPRVRVAEGRPKSSGVSIVFESHAGRMEVENIESAHAAAVIKEMFACLSTPEL